MRHVVLIVPGSLDTRTGGYEYDRRLFGGLRSLGWSVEVRELDDSFPRPTVQAREHAARVLDDIRDDSTVVIDGLAMGALPYEVGREAARLRIVGLVHHPLACETAIDPAAARELESSERQALAAARCVIATSRATAATLAQYEVDPDRIAVIEPGTDRAPLAQGSQSGSVHLLCVATLIPRKGHEVLVRALGMIGNCDWRLTCVGSLDRDPVTAERLRHLLREHGLDARVSFAGEADRPAVDMHYDGADVFVLPTLYEGYGMVVAEALAHGLPVVSTTTGGIPEIVTADAGILVPPGDPVALASALSAVTGNPDVRARLARGAARARERLPTWEEAAARMDGVLQQVGNG
jgi:glycosyltransferase involved in cell wall biosynthesis